MRHVHWAGGVVLLLAGGLLSFPINPAAAKAPLPEPDDKQVKEIEAPTRAINKWLSKGWEDQQLKPSPRTTDYQFIRRVSLDIIGRSATLQEVQAFIKDSRADKRIRLVDQLLRHEDYPKHWANVWTNWLLPRPVHPVYREQLHTFLQDQLAQHRSHKELAKMLLTATGKTNENGAINYLLAHLGPGQPADKWAEDGQFKMDPATGHASRFFLGIEIECARCHDHPFKAEIKQKDFWGLNGFFRQVERVGKPAPASKPAQPAPVCELRDNAAFNKEARLLFEKRGGGVVVARPTFLDGTALKPGEQRSRREVLAELIIGHPNFSRAFVNRMWGRFFGRGLNEMPAVDDFGEHNTVVHPELLDFLAEEFARGGHDPRNLIRWICNSDVYQLQTVTNETNVKGEADPYFSRMRSRLLSPEQRLESMLLAIRATETLTGEQRKVLRREWMKAVFVPEDWEGMETMGCGSALTPAKPIFEAMRFLLSSPQLNAAIMNRKTGTVARLQRHSDSTLALEELYLTVLNRPPTTAEIKKMDRAIQEAVRKDKDLSPFWEDLLWVLLNSSEFIANN